MSMSFFHQKHWFQTQNYDFCNISAAHVFDIIIWVIYSRPGPTGQTRVQSTPEYVARTPWNRWFFPVVQLNLVSKANFSPSIYKIFGLSELVADCLSWNSRLCWKALFTIQLFSKLDFSFDDLEVGINGGFHKMSYFWQNWEFWV